MLDTSRFLSSATPYVARNLLLCTLLTGGMLTGCTTLGPDFNAPKPTAPKSWSDWHSGDQDTSNLALNSQRQPGSNWWQSFHDPVLDQLQQRLVAASPDLQTAMLNFTRARLQSQIIASGRGVDVSASGGINREKLSEHGASMRMAAISSPASKNTLIQALAKPFTLYQAGFDAGWEPDLWGRISRSIESAKASSAGAQALLAQTRLSLQAELARAYFELRGVQKQVALLQSDIDNGKRQLALLRAHRDAGLASDLQVEQQKTRLGELRAALPSLKSSAGALQNTLALMLGEHPGALQQLLAAQATGSEQWALPTAGFRMGLPSELARRRPDIRLAEAQLHAATAEIGVAKANLYPRVTLHAGLGMESFEQGALGEWASHTWSIGPNFYLPIFNHGRLQKRVELTKVGQQQAAVHYQQTVLKAWLEIDNALTAYSAERDRYQRLEEKLSSAQQQKRLAQANLAAGLSDASAELQAQSQVIGIERQLEKSATALRVQRVAVYKAVGGGVGVQTPATQ